MEHSVGCRKGSSDSSDVFFVADADAGVDDENIVRSVGCRLASVSLRSSPMTVGGALGDPASPEHVRMHASVGWRGPSRERSSMPRADAGGRIAESRSDIRRLRIVLEKFKIIKLSITSAFKHNQKS